MPHRTGKIWLIYLIYWVLLAYIIAALVFWFVALNQQNLQMTSFKLERLQPASPDYDAQRTAIYKEKKLKVAQYIGEGSTFLILILAGAVFVFRSVRRQLRQSEEQQSFLIAITHELKTPIAVTKLNLETLQKRKLEESQQQRLIQNSLQEANRLNSLCNNLLLSSQLQSKVYEMIPEKTDLGNLAAETVADFKLRYPERDIATNITAGSIVKGDVFLLSMVLNNLLDNALKYSPKQETINVAVTAEKENILLTVCDKGPGIQAEEKKKIFLKFYRTGNDATKKAKGTGLGLFLCKTIVSGHGGKIVVKDNTGGGSCFEVALKNQNKV